MKIVFFGTPYFVIPVLQKLEENYDVVAVVTSPPTKNPSPIAVAYESYIHNSEKHEQNILTPEKLDQDFEELLRELSPDLIVVAAYGKIIPRSVLDIPKYGNLNVHPSLLPKYRGASPIQGAILNGEEKTGVTIMLMDEKMDHGPLLTTKEFSLSNQDTFETLSTKLFQEGASLLIDTIIQVTNKKLTPKPQNHEMATLTKLIKKEDGYFDINNPPSPEQLNRMIRAYYPWPTAWTKWNGKIVKFLPNSLIQMEGKKPQTIKDFLNGYPSFPDWTGLL